MSTIIPEYDTIYQQEYARHRDRFDEFRRNYSLSHVFIGDTKIQYYVAGSAEKTILAFPGAMSHPEMTFETLLDYVPQYRFIVPFITHFSSLNAMSAGINAILEKEHVGKLIVWGGSFGGMMAQAYFHRNFRKINGVIISHTYPPKKEWQSDYQKAFRMLKLFPEKILKRFALKKLLKLGIYEKSKVTPKIAASIDFYLDHFKTNVQNLITKADFLCEYRLVTEWNGTDVYHPEDYQTWLG